MCLSNSEAQEHNHMSVSLQNADATYYILAWRSVEVWDHISLNTVFKTFENRKKFPDTY
jgi:hypothetical protein